MIKFNLIVSLLILPIMATDIAAQARFTPKELPYAYDALAPQVSEETLRFHHDMPINCTLFELKFISERPIKVFPII